MKDLAERMQGLQAMYLTKALYLEDIKNSHNSIVSNPFLQQAKDMNKYFTKKENQDLKYELGEAQTFGL